MKAKSKGARVDDLRPEYDLDRLLRRGVQGKYAKRYMEGTNLVLLAPDVAEAFPTASVVNEVLRLVLRLKKVRGNGKRTTAKA